MPHYVHGASYVDEVAVLHDFSKNAEYAFELNDTYSVVGLVGRDGRLIRAYEYDVCGRRREINTHWDLFIGIRNHLGESATGELAKYDVTGDGTIDLRDLTKARIPPELPSYQPWGFQGRIRCSYKTSGTSPQTVTVYDFRARFYDPTHGRFLQRDPAEYADSYNLYLAMGGNPLMYCDPTGSLTLGDIGAAAGIGGSLYGLYERSSDVLAIVKDVRNATAWRNLLLNMAIDAAAAYVGAKALDFLVDVATPVLRRAGEAVAKKVMSRAAKKEMARVRELAKIGEEGIVKNTKRIPSSTGKAQFRVPDEWVEDQFIRETKNVAYLRKTGQLEDFMEFCKDEEIEFIIRVRAGEGTRISKTLLEWQEQGWVKIVPEIPYP